MEVLGFDVSVIIILLIILLLTICVYQYQTVSFNLWKDLGIPGPKPVVLLGSVPDNKDRDLVQGLLDWRAQYGHTFGMFLSRLPIFVTSDPELIKEIMVKQFNDFSYRYNGLHMLTDSFARKMLFLSNGGPWKRYRHLMTPAFSTGKLKAVQKYIMHCGDILKQSLVQKARGNEEIDIKDLYSRFTMDVIAGTAFGLDTNLQTGKEEDCHEMIMAMKNILKNINSQAALFLGTAFPMAGPLLKWLGFTVFPKKELEFFKQCLRSLMAQRDQEQAMTKQRVDFLQQMMELRVSDGEEVVDAEVTESGQYRTNKKLTEEDVVAQGIQIFSAAFETTSTTMQFLTYRLALHQDVQEKLYQEIISLLGKDGEPTYEQLHELKYMDAVIQETLRMYPVLMFLSRFSKEQAKVGNYTLPAGTPILIAVYTALHDPEYYTDPETFNPDRFYGQEKGDSVLSVLPFGVGPRQCIGMRLALLEIKIALVHVIRAIKFVPCDKTVKTIKFAPGVVLICKEPLIVKAELRN